MPYNPVVTTSITVNAFKTLTFGLPIKIITITGNGLTLTSGTCELYTKIGTKYVCSRC